MNPTLLERVTRARRRRRERFVERTSHWLPGWRTTTVRRRLAVGVALSFLAMFAGLLIDVTRPSLEPRWVAVAFAVLWIGGVLGVMACWGLLQVLTSHVGELPPGMLDEREAGARNAARATGFQVGLVAALFPMAYLFLRSTGTGDVHTTAYPGALMVAAVIIVGGCLPTTIIAWRQVDDDLDQVPETDPHDDEGNR